MNTAEYIVKRLEELGVNDFFGLPGDYNFNLLYAVENNPNTNWIGCTNELNAGYAADGYARMRGYGALITTYGVGELSAMNAIAGSMAENVPVIHIVGVPSTKNIESKKLIHHSFQDVNYENYINAYKNVTAATAFLNRDNAKLEIDRVLKTLVREKKPVYIAVPDDIAKMEISDKVVYYDWMSDKKTLNQAAEKIVEKIKTSEKPVIIGDALVKRFGALIEYREFVEKSGIPVTNFLMGTNLIDMDYGKYIGGYFGKYKNPIAQKYVEETDCLIAVGAIYSDLNSFGLDLPYDINSQVAIYGDYAYVDGERYDNIKMSDLLNAITKMTEDRNLEINRPNTGLKDISVNGEQLTSSYIYYKIQEYIKDNDILVAETGTVPFGVAQMKFPQNSEFESQILWGSIGWATAAALGMAIAKPQSKVILLSGDGAHQLTAMEIGTFLRLGLKPVVIVINNNGYTIERLLSNSINDKFNDITQINYSKLIRAFDGDAWTIRVSTAEDFEKALKVTQIMNKMCYIEACIDELDVLPLTKMFANSVRNGIQNTEAPSVNVVQNLESYPVQDSDFEYETVVHKALSEEEMFEEKEEENNE